MTIIAWRTPFSDSRSKLKKIFLDRQFAFFYSPPSYKKTEPSERINFMSRSIGIDLGTTNSVAAIKRVQVEILKNAEGDYLTPSCVTLKKKKLPFSKPEFVVGKNALEWMKQDPENTVQGRKTSDGEKHPQSGGAKDHRRKTRELSDKSAFQGNRQ